MTERPALRWESRYGDDYAYSGRVLVAFVVSTETGAKVLWQALTFSNREYSSVAVAKRTVNRRWTTWVRAAGLGYRS